MSTDVTLYGIGTYYLDGALPIPRIHHTLPEIGFGHFVRQLDAAPPDLILEVETDVEGERQWLILDVVKFVAHVHEDPVLWEDHGFGYDQAIRELQKYPDAIWYFIASF